MDAPDTIPCPFCGYDLRGHKSVDRSAGRTQSRCPECGEAVDHEQIVDRLPLLCERCSPLLAFFLVPIDLLQLFIPRLRLSERAPLGPVGARGRRGILLGLPFWLLVAVMAFVWVSLLELVTYIPGCGGARENPLTWAAMAGVPDYALNTPNVGACVALFISAFLVAALVLVVGLMRLRPASARGQVPLHTVHGLRRAMYVASPVFTALALAATLNLLWLVAESGADFMIIGRNGISTCCLFLVPAVLLFRLGRAGHADGGGRRALGYLACGLASIMSWFLWIALLGGLLLRKNLGQILHQVNLWPWEE